MSSRTSSSSFFSASTLSGWTVMVSDPPVAGIGARWPSAGIAANGMTAPPALSPDHGYRSKDAAGSKQVPTICYRKVDHSRRRRTRPLGRQLQFALLSAVQLARWSYPGALGEGGEYLRVESVRLGVVR